MSSARMRPVVLELVEQLDRGARPDGHLHVVAGALTDLELLRSPAYVEMLRRAAPNTS